MPKCACRLRQYDPFRSLSWRWDLAGEIAYGEVRCDCGHEGIMRDAVAYRGSHEASDPCPGQHHPENPFVAQITQALNLHKADGPQRWEIEARIVADEAPDAIAVKCGLDVDVVQYFEGLFFDARAANPWGQLSARGLDSEAEGGRGNSDVGEMWIWAAGAGGPHIVDALVTAYKNAYRSGQPHNLGVYFQAGAPVDLALQAYVAGHVLPHSPAVEAWLAEFRLRLLESQMSQSLDAAAQTRESVAMETVALVRTIMAGKPLPKIPPRAAKKRAQQPGIVGTRAIRGYPGLPERAIWAVS